MKIVFWSNEFEKSGAFLNFAAISIASVIQYPYIITILENYLGKENLGKAFFNNDITLKARYRGTGFYDGEGIETLLRRIYRGDNHSGLLRGYIKEVISEHLYYIPQDNVINSELFDYELYHNLDKLFALIEKNTDLCYINTTQQNHLSSNAILQEADLIVINLFQDSGYLDNFFKNYSSLLPKSLFLIGNYSQSSFMSCKRIAKHYNIPLEDISPIPYNEEFDVACNYGGAKEFINRNYACSKENPNYLFIHGVRRAAYTISKKAETFLSKEEIGHCGI